MREKIANSAKYFHLFILFFNFCEKKSQNVFYPTRRDGKNQEGNEDKRDCNVN